MILKTNYMSEKLLQAILEELQSLNSKMANIEEVVEIISGKMNDQEEFLEKTEKNTDRIWDEITDLQKKIVYHMPTFGNLEYIIEGEFKKINKTLNKIERNTK